MSSNSIGGMNPGPMRGVSGTERKSSKATVKPSDTGLSQINYSQQRAECKIRIETCEDNIIAANEKLEFLTSQRTEWFNKAKAIREKSDEITTELKVALTMLKKIDESIESFEAVINKANKVKTENEDTMSRLNETEKEKLKNELNGGQIKFNSRSTLGNALKGKKVVDVKFSSMEEVKQKKKFKTEIGRPAQITCSDGTVLKALVHQNDDGTFKIHGMK